MININEIKTDFCRSAEIAFELEQGKIYDEAFYSLPEDTQKAVKELLLKQSIILLKELRALGVTPSYVVLGSGAFGALHLTSELKQRDEELYALLNNKE